MDYTDGKSPLFATLQPASCPHWKNWRSKLHLWGNSWLRSCRFTCSFDMFWRVLVCNLHIKNPGVPLINLRVISLAVDLGFRWKCVAWVKRPVSAARGFAAVASLVSCGWFLVSPKIATLYPSQKTSFKDKVALIQPLAFPKFDPPKKA